MHMQYQCAIRVSLSSSPMGEIYFTFPKQGQFRPGVLLTESVLLLFRAEQQGVVMTGSLGSLKWSACLWGSYPTIDRKICKFCWNRGKRRVTFIADCLFSWHLVFPRCAVGDYIFTLNCLIKTFLKHSFGIQSSSDAQFLPSLTPVLRDNLHEILCSFWF